MQPSIIAILIYIAMYQLSSRTSIAPKVSAWVVALFPLVFSIIMRRIFGVDVLNLISWSDLFVFALQFAVTYCVFYRLHHDDSFTTWIIWGALGLITIAFIIPAFVSFLLFP